jgi:hypothetical protein
MLNIKLDVPASFFEEEVRCDFTVSTQMKEIWAVELDLLEELRRVCSKHGLRFAAEGGTLLGAVRHKGFIPWDDDIDILMPRKDYDRLCELAPHEFKHPYFLENFYSNGFAYGNSKLMNLDTTGYENPTANAHGLFIDIFPYDNIPDDEDQAKQQNEEKLRYRKEFGRIFYCSKPFVSGEKVSAARRVLRFLMHFVYKLQGKTISSAYYKELYDKYVQAMSKYKDVDTKYSGTLCCYETDIRDMALNLDLDCLIEADFEFLTIPIVASYDETLTRLYGNWNEIVKGTAWHSFIVVDPHKSYLDVLK